MVDDGCWWRQVGATSYLSVDCNFTGLLFLYLSTAKQEAFNNDYIKTMTINKIHDDYLSATWSY